MDNEDYEESCRAFRHYSDALRNIRTLAIAQGFAVLTGVALLTRESLEFLAICASLLGIVITIVLKKLQGAYGENALVAASHTEDLEKKAGGGRIWSAINRARRNRESKWMNRFAVHHAIYVALIFAFLVAMFHNSHRLIFLVP